MGANNGSDYPFLSTVYGTMSIFIDTTLRSMTLAYWMTISKAYVIIVPFLYTVLMVLVMLFTGSISDCSDFIEVTGFAVVSFACSSYEVPDIKIPRLRPISKALFTIIFVAFSIFFGVTASPKVFRNSDNSSINDNNTFLFSPSNCSNLCQYNKTVQLRSDEEQDAFENYCNNLWENIEPDTFVHQSICIVIGSLFVLSLLEWILDSCFSWTPYKRLYKDCDPNFLNK